MSILEEEQMSLTIPWPAARAATDGVAARPGAARWHVVVADAALEGPARRIVAAVLRDADRRTALDRPRSAPWRLARGGGGPVVVGPTDARLVAVALEAARLTGGLVDPTVGAAVLRHGAHADAVRARGGAFPACASLTPPRPRPAVGAGAVRVDGAAVAVPAGTVLDLSATTDPVAAHAAARAVADRLRTGALVEVGGDVAQAGPPPAGGWELRLPGGAAVRLPAGRAAATVRPGAALVVDPRTGDVASPVWAAVTVVHPDPAAAKAFALAAAVLGAAAPGWLAARDLTHRLVAPDGAAVGSPGWPHDVAPAAAGSLRDVRDVRAVLPAPRPAA